MRKCTFCETEMSDEKALEAIEAYVKKRPEEDDEKWKILVYNEATELAKKKGGGNPERNNIYNQNRKATLSKVPNIYFGLYACMHVVPVICEVCFDKELRCYP